MLWRSLRAKVHSRRGAFSEGVRLAREAVEVGRQTDSIDMQGDALMDLAEVLSSAGRSRETRAALMEALALYERKGNVVSASRAHAALASP
jgi:Flp pilus assembly protein TadD